MMLRVIGEWRLEHNRVLRDDVGEILFPDPQPLVDKKWAQTDRKRVAQYLNAGTEFESYRGLQYCCFGCGNDDDSNLGNRDLSDGVWVWPEGLSHYVENHAVRLPQEFLTHVIENHFCVPAFDVNRESKVDLEFWIKWAKAQTTN